MNIGILCPSEIAYRRFMPAITQCTDISYYGIASANAEEWFGQTENVDVTIIEQEQQKARKFQEEYGGELFDSYHALLECNIIDAVYIPLPPALHYRWAKLALEHGKHVFVEKPSTTRYKDSQELVRIAQEKGLALHENYMFAFHKQIDEIVKYVSDGNIGDVRLYRIAFGFPKRANNDFRYNKALGGGALLDCGGYTIKLAQILLGDTAELVCSHLNYTDEFDVDLYGSVTMMNREGITAQLSFGMDNSYKCELEIWGSEGCLSTGRILTAPVGYIPTATVQKQNETITLTLSEDDTFRKSIEHFYQCIQDESIRERTYKELLTQAKLVEHIQREVQQI